MLLQTHGSQKEPDMIRASQSRVKSLDSIIAGELIRLTSGTDVALALCLASVGGTAAIGLFDGTSNSSPMSWANYRGFDNCLSYVSRGGSWQRDRNEPTSREPEPRPLCNNRRRRTGVSFRKWSPRSSPFQRPQQSANRPWGDCDACFSVADMGEYRRAKPRGGTAFLDGILTPQMAALSRTGRMSAHDLRAGLSP